MSTELIVSFFTLTALEIVLGIDNVIFIAILSNKLPAEQQAKARQMGIAMAVVSRIILLFVLSIIVSSLTAEIVFGFSGRDLILILGGLFLIGKSTREIHDKLEGEDHGHGTGKAVATMQSVLIQVLILDVVFSLDSVITAIGIVGTDSTAAIVVMVSSILIAAAVMIVFATSIAEFVERHPTFKILALAFLILIGSVLVIEGANEELAHDLHIKNYVYFAMAFSVIVEVINMRVRGTAKDKVELRNRPKLPTTE